MSLDAHRLGCRLYRDAGCAPAGTHCRALDPEGRFVHGEPVTTCVHVERVHPALRSTTGLCDIHAAEARARDAATRIIGRMHSL
jgi:hypothetical protein